MDCKGTHFFGNSIYSPIFFRVFPAFCRVFDTFCLSFLQNHIIHLYAIIQCRKYQFVTRIAARRAGKGPQAGLRSMNEGWQPPAIGVSFKRMRRAVVWAKPRCAKRVGKRSCRSRKKERANGGKGLNPNVGSAAQETQLAPRNRAAFRMGRQPCESTADSCT